MEISILSNHRPFMDELSKKTPIQNQKLHQQEQKKGQSTIIKADFQFKVENYFSHLTRLQQESANLFKCISKDTEKNPHSFELWWKAIEKFVMKMQSNFFFLWYIFRYYFGRDKNLFGKKCIDSTRGKRQFSYHAHLKHKLIENYAFTLTYHHKI
jgi:hypothetical protein